MLGLAGLGKLAENTLTTPSHLLGITQTAI